MMMIQCGRGAACRFRCEARKRRRVPVAVHQRQQQRLLFALCLLLALYCCCNIPGSSRGAPFVVAAAAEVTSEEQNKKSSASAAKEEEQQQQGECAANSAADGSCSASATEENAGDATVAAADAATTNDQKPPQQDQPKQEKDRKEKKKKIITKPQKWVPLSESTWAVSATSPEPRKPSGDNMMDNDEVVGKDMNLSPYVHWTCYRMRKSSTAKSQHASDDKLHCCQTIYRMQQQFAGNLCWKRGGCRRDKKKRGGQEFHGKSEFMQYCIEQLTDVPPPSPSLPSTATTTKTGNDDGSTFDPRYTLVVLPERVDTYERRRLEEQPEGEQRYRQAIIFSTSTEGQFFYDIPVLSPLQLVIDPFEFYFDKQQRGGSRPGVGDEYDVVDLRTEEQKTKEEEERRAKYQKAENEPVRFAAKLATTMYASSDDDDERALHQRANVTLPPELVEEQKGLQRVLWTRITLRILVFLPQDTYLPTRRRNLSSCRQQQQQQQQDDQRQQQQSDVECMLAWKLKQQQESASSGKKKKSYTSSPSEVQEVYELTVNLHPVNNPYATSQISLEWMMKIILEEEDLLLAAPVIFQGTVLHKSKAVDSMHDKKPAAAAAAVDIVGSGDHRAAIYSMMWDQGGNATKIACPISTAAAAERAMPRRTAALLWNKS